VLRAANANEAKRIVLDQIPAGSQVHLGASQSLELSGIAEKIETSGRYDPVARECSAWIARRRPTTFAA
jgi:hypothetical protein